MLVGAGILLSRLFGLVRDRVFAHYFGNSWVADAYRAAFRIPNLLQNLFGEGSLSASFIPVYARLRSEGKAEEAQHVASGVLASLGLLVALVVALGVTFAPALVAAIAPGFTGEKRELTIRLVRILFPGAGLLVLSAWCLGILNSHRRFFLSYAAPVVWNAVLIAAMITFGGRGQETLAPILAWASVAGSALQFLIQAPLAVRLAGRLRAGFFFALESVRTVLRNFLPACLGRGVVQISAFVDELIASLLPHGAMAALGYAQTLYLLPVSLFGMSVSAAELPAMSEVQGDPEKQAAALRERIGHSLRRIALLVVPSAIGFLALGDVVVGAIYQTGEFTRADVMYVWAVLAGYAAGLLAATLGRLYASAFYALRDTRTPLLTATCRVLLGAGLGAMAALLVPRWLGLDLRFGVAGLTAAAGLAAWVELAMLRRFLNRRVGRTGLPMGFVLRLLFSGLVAAGVAFGLARLLSSLHPIPQACAVLSLFGVAYFGLAALLGIEEARGLWKRLRRVARRA
ncbi:MAG: murein biosynthesis integral membrane protein MurJ [Myxococcales bacterium]|nr:murein biosynthesis integral membrane protein MurJ [Myxococcales bacterium]